MYCTRCGAWMEDRLGTCPSCGAPTDSSAFPMDGGAPATDAGPTSYAGFWLRLVAYIIDSLILSAAFLLALLPIAPMLSGTGEPIKRLGLPPTLVAYLAWFFALTFIGTWLYYALFESSSWQGTPGKRAIGLYVTDLRGSPISFGRATARYFGKILSNLILCIGYIMAGFTSKKQALHDILAECLVLRRA